MPVKRYKVFISVFLLFYSCRFSHHSEGFPFHETEWQVPERIPLQWETQLFSWQQLPYRTIDLQTLPSQTINFNQLPTKVFPEHIAPRGWKMSDLPFVNLRIEDLESQSLLLQQLPSTNLGWKSVWFKPAKVIKARLPRLLDYAQSSLLHLGQEQGLPGTVVHCMLQDRYRRIWFGTDNGLACYDGHRLHIFTTKSGLASPVILSLLEDHKGRIWIGTQGGGLQVIEKTRIKTLDRSNGLKSNTINALLEDQKGQIWVATNRGVHIITDDKMFYLTKKNGLRSSKSIALLQDYEGRIWIGTREGAHIIDKDRIYYLHQKNGLKSNLVWTFLQDSKKRIWIGTLKGGIHIFTGTQLFYWNSSHGLRDNRVLSIIEDALGRIWIGMQKRGVHIIDGNTLYLLNQHNGLKNTKVNALLSDVGGYVWVGTDGGGAYMVVHPRSFYLTAQTGIQNPPVSCLYKGPKGTIWAGTNGGVHIISPTQIRYLTQNNGLRGNAIRAFLKDHNGQMWIGTNRSGINILNNNKILYLSNEQGLADNVILALLEDHQQRIWIGMLEGGAQVFTQNRLYSVLESATILTFLEASNGAIWIGTANKGVYVVQQNQLLHLDKSRGLKDNTVAALLEDTQGRIWIGTRGGLHIYDGEQLWVYTTEQGLSDNSIHQLAQDSLGRVWVGTAKGIICFVATQDSTTPFFLIPYKREHGFLYVDANAPGNPMLYDSTHHVLWTSLGATLVHWKLPQKDTTRPSVFITGIGVEEKILDGRLPTKEDTISWDSLFQSLNPYGYQLWQQGARWVYDDQSVLGYFLPKNLSLPHHLNHITFYFSGYRSGDWQDDIVFRYMLEGFDTTWSPITKEVYADYRNLPPGQYTFRVRARGRNYRWSEEQTFSFEIRPPWYQTLWAYFLYGLTATAMVVAIVWLSILRVQAKRKEKAYIAEIERLSLVARETSNAIYICRPNGEIFWVNEAFKHFTGYDTLEEFKKERGKTLQEAIHHPDIQQLFERCLNNRVPVRLEWENVRKDGAKRYVQTTLTPVVKGNEVLWIAAIDTDVTALQEEKRKVELAYEELHQTHKELEKAHRSIQDSITYASYIQRSFLPSERYCKEALGEHFILYLPRDVVSGDFYWVYQEGDKVFFAACDCTGHGVPGAFMSMVCNDILHQLVIERGLRSPATILTEARKRVIHIFTRGGEKPRTDGMDCALCLWDKATNIITFAGANRPLYICRANTIRPEEIPEKAYVRKDFQQILIVRGDKMSIGYEEVPKDQKSTFSEVQIKVQPGDMLYLFSDGYVDQVGGRKGKKLGTRQFLALLQRYYSLRVSEQKQQLYAALLQWQGNYRQVDDILLMGVRIPKG